VTLNICP